jgi:hypothetical protein
MSQGLYQWQKLNCPCGEIAENDPGETCSRQGLENHIAFPPFSSVPDIDCYEMRGPFYYSGWKGEHGGNLVPTRHWCVIGEIEIESFSPIRKAMLFKTRWGEKVAVWFYNESFPIKTFSLADCKVGNTIAILYGERKVMADGSTGIRQEYPHVVYVFRAPMSVLLNASECITEGKCHSCKRDDAPEHPQRLQQCSKCKVVKYCSRECQLSGWSSHKRVCSQMDVFSSLLRIYQTKFENPRLDFTNLVERIQKMDHQSSK